MAGVSTVWRGKASEKRRRGGVGICNLGQNIYVGWGCGGDMELILLLLTQYITTQGRSECGYPVIVENLR